MSRRAKEAAREILNRFGSKVPVEVEAIVEAHGISIFVEDVEVSISGMLVIKGERAHLILNQLHPIGRMRFTLAHELGHYLLHRDKASVFIDETALFYRGARAKQGVDPMEIEANAFAAELLMPENVLRAELGARPLHSEYDDEIQKLAPRYGVSAAAMTNRLKTLKLVALKA
jgi:Zn-dependent peptidase ImmA (M78 family)